MMMMMMMNTFGGSGGGGGGLGGCLLLSLLVMRGSPGSDVISQGTGEDQLVRGGHLNLEQTMKIQNKNM